MLLNFFAKSNVGACLISMPTRTLWRVVGTGMDRHQLRQQWGAEGFPDWMFCIAYAGMLSCGRQWPRYQEQVREGGYYMVVSCPLLVTKFTASAQLMALSC
jgi:hypothetical protein